MFSTGIEMWGLMKKARKIKDLPIPDMVGTPLAKEEDKTRRQR
jgi:hypothetical protein